VSDVKPIVRIPGTIKVRLGRGFSLGELKEANINLHDAKRIGLRVDLRRRSTHKENVESLRALLKELQKAEKKKGVKEDKKTAAKKEKESRVEETQKEISSEAILGGRTPLTTLKGLGPKTEAKLREVGVESVEELAEEDAELLSEATGIGVQKLSSWISEAKQLVKERRKES